ncbi:MAG: hypothetical protein ABJF88_15190 [Rhodothermales bacterium]
MQSTNSGGGPQAPSPKRNVARHALPSERTERPAIPGGRTSSTSYKAASTAGGGGLDECPWPVGDLTDRSTGEVFGKPCERRWCPYCGERLYRCHVAHFTEVFRDLPDLFAVTLTLDPKVLPEEFRYDARAQEAVLVEKVWTPFRSNFTKDCKKAGVAFTYVGAHERHGGRHGGVPHIHALVSCPLPDAEEAMAARWFHSGGGAVLSVEPVEGGERGVARWLGYCFKGWFGKTAPRHRRLLSNNGIGYHSAAAKARRREHVEDPDRFAYTPPEEGLRREDPGRVRAALPVGAIELQFDRRSTRYLRYVEGTPYGVQVDLDERGAQTYTLVETGPQYKRRLGGYPTVGKCDSMAAAKAEANRLANEEGVEG